MKLPVVLLMSALQLTSQPPAISRNGVQNAASRIPSTMPLGAISRGARFLVHGVRLGTSGSGTIVRVSTTGGANVVPTRSVSSSKIEAIMPLEAPLGDAELTVNAAGKVSQPIRLRIVRSAFGAYSVNEEGWGPGRIQLITGTKRTVVDFRHPATPGQVVALAGTGLGQGVRFEVLVAGKPATVTGTSIGNPDEIRFSIPPKTPEGCYVPIQVRSAGGHFSNTVTMPVRSTPGPCEYFFPPSSWKRGKFGIILLSRTVPSNQDDAAAVFVNRIRDESPADPLLLPPVDGSCTTRSSSALTGLKLTSSWLYALTTGIPGSPLDAGAILTASNAGRQIRMRPAPGLAGAYHGRLSSPARRPTDIPLDTGDFIISGDGGKEIGRFAISQPIPAPFQWTNRASITTVNRSAGMTVRWSDVTNRQSLAIVAASVDAAAQIGSITYCLAAGEPGSYTVSSDYLANLPATSEMPGSESFVLVATLPKSEYPRFSAPGLDNGFGLSLYVHAVPVRFR